MTLTDELGDIPPLSHTWMAPVVEDMLQEVRDGLTEAVVIRPGKAILFYGRDSMGEGLKVDVQPSQIAQMDLDIPDEVGGIKKKHT